MSHGSSANPTRRAILAASALAAPAGGALAADRLAAPASDYGFDPGLTYLNTASLGPTPGAIQAVMARASAELETDPVYMSYGAGPLLTRSDQARAQLAAFLGCDAEQLLITRSTTDAMNTLALGMRLGPGDRVLTTDQEHEGATYCWEHLARHRGVLIDTIPIAPSDHHPAVLLERFARAMRPDTRVVSFSHVVSATGLRMPAAEIVALARAHGAFSVVDGAQALGQIPVDVRALGCHAYAAPGHKWMMGPKGTGLLYLSPDAGDRVDLVQLADGHRFICNSTGVGCLPLVFGFAAAARAMQARGMAAVEGHNLALGAQAYEGMARMARLRLASPPPGPQATALVAARLPDEVDSRALRDVMRTRYGIVIKMAEKRWFNGIRLSPHIFNDAADIDRALAAIGKELG